MIDKRPPTDRERALIGTALDFLADHLRARARVERLCAYPDAFDRSCEARAAQELADLVRGIGEGRVALSPVTTTPPDFEGRAVAELRALRNAVEERDHALNEGEEIDDFGRSEPRPPTGDDYNDVVAWVEYHAKRGLGEE